MKEWKSNSQLKRIKKRVNEERIRIGKSEIKINKNGCSKLKYWLLEKIKYINKGKCIKTNKSEMKKIVMKLLKHKELFAIFKLLLTLCK